MTHEIGSTFVSAAQQAGKTAWLSTAGNAKQVCGAALEREALAASRVGRF